MFNRFFLAPFALAGALVGASVAAFAQSAPPPAQQDQGQQGAPQDQGQQPGQAARPHHASKMHAVLESLNLSSDQQAQIKGFMRSYRQSKQTSTPETRQQMLAQIEGVLTPSQQAQFKAGMRRHAPPPPDGQQGPAGDGQQAPSDGNAPNQAPPPNPQ